MEHLLVHLFHHGREHVLLAREVGVEGAGGDAGFAGDVGDLGVEEAVALEHPARRLDEGLTRPRAARADRRSPRPGWEGLTLRHAAGTS